MESISSGDWWKEILDEKFRESGCRLWLFLTEQLLLTKMLFNMIKCLFSFCRAAVRDFLEEIVNHGQLALNKNRVTYLNVMLWKRWREQILRDLFRLLLNSIKGDLGDFSNLGATPSAIAQALYVWSAWRATLFLGKAKSREVPQSGEEYRGNTS